MNKEEYFEGLLYLQRSKVKWIVFNALFKKPLLFDEIVEQTGLKYGSVRTGLQGLVHKELVRSKRQKGKNTHIYGLTPQGVEYARLIEKNMEK